MITPRSTRVPVNDGYATLVGKAVYVFAYYEWTLLWIIERLKKGFLHTYSRRKTMTSGAVLSELKSIIDSASTDFSTISKPELQICCDTFEQLIIKRNALIHAHPCTDTDGSQILNYQTLLSKPLPDMKWPECEISQVISEFDKAACDAGILFEKIR